MVSLHSTPDLVLLCPVYFHVLLVHSLLYGLAVGNSETVNNSAALAAPDNSLYHSSKDDPNFIAKSFVKQLQSLTNLRKSESRVKYKAPKYFNMTDDPNTSSAGIENSSSTEIQKPYVTRPLKVKVTDHIAPVMTNGLTYRNGKSIKHYTDGIGHYKNSSYGPLPIFTVKQKLDPKSWPLESLLDLSIKNAANFVYSYELAEDVKDYYFLAVSVEKMSCRRSVNDSDQMPMLSIHGKNQDLSICKTFDNSLNKYQSVEFVLSGEQNVDIRAVGNWFGVSASLVVSIYTETSSCQNCPQNHFCCGNKETSCGPTSEKHVEKKVSQLNMNPRHRHDYFRCIPRLDPEGSSLVCNGHPNCGFYCNADELSFNCLKDEDENDDGQGLCDGYYCREYQQDRFMITLLLLILFCVVFPLCIFVFVCGKKDIIPGRADRSRCPLPLELAFCPFSINPEEDNHGGTNNSTSNGNGRAARGHRRGSERNPQDLELASGVLNASYIEDPPPSYDECCANKMVMSPIHLRSSDNDNTNLRNSEAASVNAAVVPPYSLQLHSMPCSNTAGQSSILSANSYTTSLGSSETSQ